MYPFDKENPFRKVSVKLLVPILIKTGLSANKITALNFLLLGLGSVTFFAIGYEYLGLLTASLMAMIDYVDGTIARLRNENSPKGEYLDTSLDWLYLMLLIGAISYYHNIMVFGYIMLIALTFGNWVKYFSLVKVPDCPTFIIPTLVIGIILKRADISIIVLTLFQCLRTGGMYLWSISRH